MPIALLTYTEGMQISRLQQPQTSRSLSTVSSPNANGSPAAEVNGAQSGPREQVCLTGRCPAPSQPVVSEASPEGPRRSPLSEVGLTQALSELQGFSEREYYNEAADSALKTEYYQGIDWSADPKELFGQLSNKTKGSHEKVLPYRPSVYLYPWVDLHPDGQLRSIYSAEAMDPATAIIEDWQIGQDERLAESALVFAAAALSPEAAATAFALDQQDQAFNCEHVVPQSWFGRRQPDRGDLHHLFACNMRCNSMRSNYPFAEAKVRDQWRDDCGQVIGGNKGFEPVGGKGAVARATLYYLLRYPNTISNYDSKDVDMLMEWHRDNPVTLYEKHRNVAIEELQGNRNPLIDFPEMAHRVDFTEGLRSRGRESLANPALAAAVAAAAA